MYKIRLCKGKYECVFDEADRPLEILRHGLPWITEDQFDNGHIALAVRLAEALEELDIAINIIEDSGVDFEEVKQAYLED